MPEPSHPDDLMVSLTDVLTRSQPWLEGGAESLLQAVVDGARQLVHATFAGIVLLDSVNPSELKQFKVSGWDSIPPEFPKGHGMFLVPARTGHSLRVESVPAHPLSVGVPSAHPPVEALLTIPLTHQGRPVGSLFLGRPETANPFTPQDEQRMNDFASVCAAAIAWCSQYDEQRDRSVADERRRIAEVLHDSLSQTLFAVAREMDGLEQALPAVEQRGTVQTHVARLHELTQQSQSDLRAMLFRLMDDATAPDAIALAHLVQDFERITGVSTRLATQGNFSRLTLPIRQTLVKIVAESLTNIYRHANSQVAVVHVDIDQTTATIAVQDAGIGIPDAAVQWMTHATGHFGLHSMARSVADLHGTMEIFRNDDGGTTIRCVLPIHDASGPDQ